MKKTWDKYKKRSRSPVVSMPPPARPSSLLSLLSRLSVRVLLRCRTNVPKEICPQWLSPKQPWSGKAASSIYTLTLSYFLFFTAVFGGQRGKVLTFEMTHKACRKAEFMFLVFQIISSLVFPEDHQRNRLRWRLAWSGGCRILAFPPRFPTRVPKIPHISTYLHAYHAPRVQLHSRPDRNFDKLFLMTASLLVHTTNRVHSTFERFTLDFAEVPPFPPHSLILF